VGSKIVDLVGPRDAVETVVAVFSSGAVDDVRTERRIRSPAGDFVPVRVWSRAIELDGARVGVSLVVPVAEVGRLGRDPAAPWRDLAPVAVGTADGALRIEGVSRDVRDVLGLEPAECVGSSMLDMIHPDDVGQMFGPESKALRSDGPRRHVRFRHRDGSWINVCLLIAPLADEDSGRLAFALVGAPHLQAGQPSDRIAELELRLRHIGAEVRAAGVLEDVDRLPAVSDYPELGELTSRQWEILSRLVRGDRVATIASALYLSPSTVRNHLAAIFRKFGVHSQIELVDILRRRSAPRTKAVEERAP
jgi:PAS domain S-box-containing protein